MGSYSFPCSCCGSSASSNSSQTNTSGTSGGSNTNGSNTSNTGPCPPGCPYTINGTSAPSSVNVNLSWTPNNGGPGVPPSNCFGDDGTGDCIGPDAPTESCNFTANLYTECDWVWNSQAGAQCCNGYRILDVTVSYEVNNCQWRLTFRTANFDYAGTAYKQGGDTPFGSYTWPGPPGCILAMSASVG